MKPPQPSSRILVVDDQPANIQLVGAVLGKLGHEIIPATDGPTALRRAALHPPDLILLDMLMPEMDGCEVCRRLHATPEGANIPVIFLSAADNKDFIVRALESGGVDYVTKPFNQAELVSRVQTQLALKHARDRLTQMAEDKDELLGILTHDLKNHLGGMQMSAQLLQERLSRGPAPDARTAMLAENIQRTGDQMLAFVKEFLANAAADRGAALNLTKLSFSEAAATAVHHYEEAARRKQLQVEIICPTAVTAVLADPSAVSQVLDNLLSNAVKFSPPGRRITVRMQAGAGFVECQIQDEGPGFTDEDKARMFRRYTRLSARPTGGEPSTGLGLSIVRKLVLAMEGELRCESTPGQGTTFTIRLPAAETTTSS